MELLKFWSGSVNVELNHRAPYSLTGALTHSCILLLILVSHIPKLPKSSCVLYCMMLIDVI